MWGMSIRPVGRAVLVGIFGPGLDVTPLGHTVSMAAQQLLLIDSRPLDWKLDQRTIERGKQGVQSARAALKESVARAEKRRAEHNGANRAAA